MGAKLNIDLYRRAYFYFDEPAEYTIQNKVLKIYPISVKDSEIFLSSMSVIDIDKNATDSVEIIQMSYLEFIYKCLFNDELNISKFLNICKYCLHIENPEAGFDENQKPFLKDNAQDIVIKAKDFDNIRRIILYQNLINYDDGYINPDLKAAMDAEDKLKNKNINMPSLERRMAIITAHCGLSKLEQHKMTFRAHNLLFIEVCGEVDFITVRPIAIYAGNKIDHWIFAPSKQDKFANYITSESDMQQKFGGIENTNAIGNKGQGEHFDSMYNNFNKEEKYG